ncbi:MAG: SIR2 family protein, partial [Thermoanaerobaculia bacterium]
MSHELVNDLRAEIAKGHVLVVVGAGVSVAATQGNPLASWQGLLENGVERCVAVRGLDAKWASRVREEIRSGDLDDLLSAAEKVSSKLGFPDSGEYRRWLHDTVGKLELKDRSILDAIRDLGLPIATTNYDGLLEEVTHRPALTWRDGDKAARVIRGVEPGILHLHGYWEAPESVILGIRSY